MGEVELGMGWGEREFWVKCFEKERKGIGMLVGYG